LERTVIASVAKQSISRLAAPWILRFARNDEGRYSAPMTNVGLAAALRSFIADQKSGAC